MSETVDELLDETQADEPLHEPLRFRAAEQIGVDFPQRIIELIVSPYEQEALVPYKGRMVTEIFSRGAYDGIQRRANRVRVNRDHQPERTVGRAVALQPSHDLGLVAKLRIARTPLGDETLELAADECLDASAGYLPMRGGEQWETRSRVRIRKAWLGHIALVPEPAYEGARVLAVRSQPELAPPAEIERVPTPNLDEVRAWQLQQEYARLQG